MPRSLGVLMVWIACFGAASAADVRDATDHPLLSRYEGAEIAGYLSSKYDSYVLTTKPSAQINDRKSEARGLALEGAYTAILYRAPAGRSTLEVMANYRAALQRGGFETVWACDSACGTTFALNQTRGTRAPVPDLTWYDAKDTRYLAAKQARPGGDVYVAVLVASSEGKVKILVEVLEAKELETGKVVVRADALQAGLKRDGKVALYAVYFDTDQATLKPESKPQLDEIAQWFRSVPELQVFVVGHTDAQGTFDHNMDLSRRRAEAIAAALVRDYGIARARLSAASAGPLAPLASNQDEAGRARNRRVEIVEKLR